MRDDDDPQTPPTGGWSLRADQLGFSFRIADAALAHNARRMFGAYLAAQAEPGSDFHAAELIFGELLGNVARHAPGPVDVQLRWDGTRAILEVIDRGPGYTVDEPTLPDDLSESRRGLFLIATFGAELIVRCENGVTTTSVVLPVTRRPWRRR
ncbi:MAG: ATP-binding protein [Vulcanimicrobiaceae bacterium]|jgi:anti-sigma regulatory factor (Ser/Thr protein kinase)